MGKYFGTDGFRGEANVDLTVEHAYKVGRFLGWYYGKKNPDEKCRVVIGKDSDHHPQRLLRGAHGRISLRHHDLRQPQPLL